MGKTKDRGNDLDDYGENFNKECKDDVEKFKQSLLDGVPIEALMSKPVRR
jgi:hypothetical protein